MDPNKPRHSATKLAPLLRTLKEPNVPRVCPFAQRATIDAEVDFGCLGLDVLGRCITGHGTVVAIECFVPSVRLALERHGMSHSTHNKDRSIYLRSVSIHPTTTQTDPFCYIAMNRSTPVHID